MNWMNNTWLIFHIITYDVNIDFDKKFNIFFESFKSNIPCGVCKNHYREQMKNISFYDYIYKKKLFELMIDTHNNVNKKKKVEIWSYDKARDYYKNYKLKREDLIYFINFYSNLRNNEIIEMLKSFIYLVPIKDIRKQLIYYEFKNPLNNNNKKIWVEEIKNLINKHYK